jgi:hypothetical protein
MGDNLKVGGQVGKSCSSYATPDSQEMAYQGFSVLLAVEISPQGWPASNFPADAGANL